MSDYSQLDDQQLGELLQSLLRHPAAEQDPSSLQHELRVHQVELEVQNRDLREIQQQLEASRQRYLTLYELAPVGYLQLDDRGWIRQSNSAGAALLQQSAEKLVGRSIDDWLSDSADRQRFRQHLDACLAEPGQTHQLELLIRHHDAPPRAVLVISQAVEYRYPARECLTVLVDITDRNRIAALQHDVQHDPLTGLANRTLLMQRLELALQRAARHETFHFALLFVDLNRFKAINDRLGHETGDQLLIALAAQLQTFVRQVDLAARLAGDEFVILLEDISGLQQAVQIAERIVETLKKPLRLASGQELFVSVSIGIASNSGHHDSAAELLHEADTAMYRAKRDTRQAAIEIFHPEMHAEEMARLDREQELRQALERDDQLLLYFQPVVALADGRIQELEALVRWQHPRHGLLCPEDFIDVAEETGLIEPLGQWVLHRACEQLQGFRTRFPALRNLCVSVNLSSRQCRNSNLAQHLATILKRTGLPGACLNLEINEHQPIRDTTCLTELPEQLRQLGVDLSIDDFGTGFSTLSHLPCLAPKYLKMDPSVIAHLGDQNPRSRIPLAILGLARQLELEVVAKGVETPAQRDFLHRAGCRLGQGGLFSPPLPAAALEKLLAHQSGEVTRHCR